MRKWQSWDWNSGLSLSMSSFILWYVVVVQSLSCFWLFETPWTAACQAYLSFTISWSLLRLMSTESVMLSDRLVACRPLPLLPSISLSIRVFSNESALCIRWPALASVLPVNIQGWLPLGLTSLISLQSKGLSRIFSSAAIWKHQFFGTLPSLWSNSHIHTWLLEKS